MHILSNVKLYLDDKREKTKRKTMKMAEIFGREKQYIRRIKRNLLGGSNEWIFRQIFASAANSFLRFICKVLELRRALRISLNLNSHTVINV